MALKDRSFFQRFQFEALYNTFLALQPREQVYALVGAGILILLVIGLPISLASSKLGGLEQQIEEGRQKEDDILREIEKYYQVQAELDAIKGKIEKGYDSRLTTTMESLAEKAGIKDRIDNIKEKGSNSTENFDEVSVEVRVSKVTLPQFIDYLYSIENHPQLFLRVKELQIKRRFDNRQLLDVPKMVISTYRLTKLGE